MFDEMLDGGLIEQTLQDVGYDYEEERGERVALSKATFALDPWAGGSIEEYCGFSSEEKRFDPGNPFWGETSNFKNVEKSRPADGIEGFGKIQLDNKCRGLCPGTDMENVCGIEKVFRNSASREETSLVRVNKKWYDRLKSVSE